MDQKAVGLCGFEGEHQAVKTVDSHKEFDADWVVEPGDGVDMAITMIESGCPDILVVRKNLGWLHDISSYLAKKGLNPFIVETDHLRAEMLAQ
jgi:hypothetical protein